MLRLYETAVVAVNWKQQRIKFLTRDNPEQQRSLPTLEALVNRNLDIASKIIAARRGGIVEGASAALNARGLWMTSTNSLMLSKSVSCGS